MVDEDGEPVMESCYINVKDLVECGSVEKVMALLGIGSALL